MPRSFGRAVQVLVAALLLGIPYGVALGAVRAGHFPLARAVLRTEVADAVVQSLLAAIPVALLYLLLRGALKRAWMASALVLVPPALWLAFQVNRSLLPDLLSATSLIGNAVTFAALAAAGALAHVGLARWRDGAWESGRAPLLALGVLAVVPIGLDVASRIRDPGPDVVVILIDILGADHLGCYGYERPTSPNIDRFAEEAVLFEQAISSATFTKTSVASLFTGLYPHHHGVYEGTLRSKYGYESDVLALSNHTLAEHLADLGFHNAAWVENGQLRGYMGFDQGFHQYLELPGSAEAIAAGFREWFGDWAHRTRYFAYLHLLDLHAPYNPPAPYRGRFGPDTEASRDIDHDTWRVFKAEVNDGVIQLSDEDLAALEARHDEKLMYVDEWVGRILDDLRASGRWDDTLVVITSDHGEAFWEHGFLAHSKPPYEELVHVPLIVKLPGSAHAGRRVESMVGLVDFAPTLIELLGGDPPRGIDGTSFASAFDDTPGPLEPRKHFMEHHLVVGVRTERWKFIRRGEGTIELYDLHADPGEQSECGELHPDVAAELHAACIEAIGARNELGTTDRVTVDPETLEQLKGLGYL